MSDWMMENTERDLREILGDFLSKRTHSAKDLARLIDCEPRTAEGFRAGRYWPGAKHWRLIVRTFGRDIWTAVFEPEIDETLARLRREQRDLEERLYEIRALRRQALGGLDSAEERLVEAEDRSIDPRARDLFDLN